MRNLFFLLIGLFFLWCAVLLQPVNVSAHSVGQPPFLKLNGKYAGFYSVPLSSDFFVTPQDQSPENYLVNTPIVFEIDPVALQVPQEIIKNSTFRWEFGDDSFGSGLNNTHTYTKQGSYILNITAKYKTDDAQLIESDVIQVLPDANYVLPTASIKVNGHEIADPVNDVRNISFQGVTFEVVAHDSSSPATYIWDLGDNVSSKALSVTHSYDKKLQLAYPILRTKDANGFFTDAYVQMENADINPAGVIVKPTPSASPIGAFTPAKSQIPLTPASSSIFSIATVRISQITSKIFSDVLESNLNHPLLFLFAVGLIFIAGGLHALTPGHGKSMMTAFLVGKKGSKFADILLLAISITVTHTAVIFILGFVFLFLDQKHTLVDVLPYFEKGGAILVILLAARLIINGARQLQHQHNHEHGHDHTHEHLDAIAEDVLGRKTILFAGFSGGIVPCTDAFALLLLLATAGRVLLGMVFVLVFSVGLAVTIIALGLLVVLGKKTFALEDRLGHLAETYVPIASGVILAIIALKLLL
ncbi:MAG TPA: PKD domain-containing protein [Candidatus Saccharimonadia bacterium]|nr:PKD domain-containing protein [Candidatus Saccharimonadia bacterium]